MGRIGTPLGLAIGAPIRGTWVPKIDTSVLGGVGNNGNNGYYNGGLEDDPEEITLGNDGTARHGYFLFTGVGVPQGATIISAYVNVTASNDANETVVNIRIVGSDEDNPSKPTNAADAAGRPRTDADVYWNNVQPWTRNVTYRSPDIKAIIQEIVSRSGFGENAILIFFEDNGSTNGSERKGKSYKGDPAKSATLTITYIEEEAPVPVIPIGLDFSYADNSMYIGVI